MRIRMLKVNTDGTSEWVIEPDSAPAAPPPYPLSKLTIMQRLVSLGKWQAFKAVLAQPEWELAHDAFYLADFVASDNDMFTAAAPALKAAVGLTDEQFAMVIAPEG